MTFLLAQAGWLSHFVLGSLMLLAAVFLILLVLVQRGRGGGLTGALGGMGGQSAFGTKAGDVFTKITMWTAAVWIVLCALAIVWLTPKSRFGDETTGVQLESSETPGEDDRSAGTGGDDKDTGDKSDAATKANGGDAKTPAAPESEK